jgi:predicted ATP-dependent protease
MEETILDIVRQEAIEERFNRQALAIRRYQENFMDSGMLLLEHEGSKVGQINALVVFTLSSEISFGSPSRITARPEAFSQTSLPSGRTICRSKS